MKFCTDENIKIIEDYINKHRDEILSDLMTLVRIPSIKADRVADKPYGHACAKALEASKNLFDENGFETKINTEYGYALAYYGNKQAKSIGIFSHSDVVPVGGEWLMCEPFEPVIRDGHVFGRGCNDNKSGVITALYAAKMIKDLGFNLKNRLVMFVGSNEETGMKDIDAFSRIEKMPDASLVPDAEYPCISGEKSMIDFDITSKKPLESIKKFCGGKAFNIILDDVDAELVYNEKLYEEIKALISQDNRFKVKADENTIFINAKGISKHAAYPEGSVNAAVILADMLCKCDLLCQNDKNILADLSRLVTDYYGAGFGIQHEDCVFGKLTSANGIVSMTEDNCLNAVFNLRFGTSCDFDVTCQKIKKAVENVWNISEIKGSQGYNIEDDSVVLKATEEVYRYISGNADAKAEKCSGGTYARHIKNALPVGTVAPYKLKNLNLPDGHGDVHQPDESLSIEAFFESIKIVTCMIMEIDCVL